MDGISKFIIRKKGLVVALTLILTLIFAYCFFQVKINYNMTDYLPEDANSTVALNLMEEEFGEAIPNCNVMVKDVSIEEALSVKAQLERIDGISNVTWMDDTVDIQMPLETQDMIDDYYRDGSALFAVTIEEGKERAVTDQIEEDLGEDVLMNGNAVEQADSQRMALTETMRAICVLAPLIILVLIIATTSWVEPFIYLLAIGAAVLINLGTEIFRGEISYVTLAVAPMLQMAVSLDYAVFLSASYSKHKKKTSNNAKAMRYAMKDSLKSIAASALTTIFGFFALTLMDFKIGPDMGISLVKGVILSFISCMTFLPAAILLMDKLIEKTRHRKFMPSFKGAGRVAVKIRIPIFLVVAVLAVFCYLAQGKNEFTYGSGDAAGNTAASVVIKETFGEKNTMVLMVPNTNRSYEIALCDKIEKMNHVTDVLSYTTQVGAQIPPEYLSDAVRENFYGEHYARIIIYSDLPDECDEAFTLVENIRKEAKKLYGDDVLSCGQSANLYDMKNTVETDNRLVNIVTVIAIYLILLITLKSWILPVLLILTIKIAIWINMAIPFFAGSSLVYLGYLVVSTVQMGATIDYAILLADHYLENRKKYKAKEAMVQTMGEVIPSVLVSASMLAIAGFALALVSSNGMVVSLGILIGRGALLPLVVVHIFLPALLILFDKLIFTDKRIPLTMWEIEYYKEEDEEPAAGPAPEEAAAVKSPGFLGVKREINYDDYDETDIWTDGGKE